MGLKEQCRSVQGDFMAMPFADASFDGVYAIEATCHAPDRTKVTYTHMHTHSHKKMTDTREGHAPLCLPACQSSFSSPVHSLSSPLQVFSEIFRVLKPGQVFACYEWCLTPAYDKGDAAHRLIKKQIEEGDGLPDTAYTWEMDEALRKVSRAADSFIHVPYKQASKQARDGSIDRTRPCLSVCLSVCL